MPEYINGKPKVIEDLLETLIKNFPFGKFVCVHDGSKEPTDIDYLEKPTFFTRVYQWVVDDEPVKTQITFKYDLRTGRASAQMSHYSLEEFARVLEQITTKVAPDQVKHRLDRIKEVISSETKEW